MFHQTHCWFCKCFLTRLYNVELAEVKSLAQTVFRSHFEALVSKVSCACAVDYQNSQHVCVCMVVRMGAIMAPSLRFDHSPLGLDSLILVLMACICICMHAQQRFLRITDGSCNMPLQALFCHSCTAHRKTSDQSSRRGAQPFFPYARPCSTGHLQGR